MKLPFDFATKFILRLVLPGALFAALLWPAAAATLESLGVTPTPAIGIPVLILVAGWLTLLMDMPIYMLFEGRRFWPAGLRKWFLDREAKRLAELIADRASAKASGDLTLARERGLDMLDFPMSEKGVRYAAFPTRLGNLLTAIETYPDRKYGIDGVWAWSRLWVAADKDLRGEMDDQQAVADSGLYGAFALLCAGPVCLGYALIVLMWPRALPLLPSSPPLLLAFASAAPVAGWSLYRLSLFAQRQYGELFKALFDQLRTKLDVADLVNGLATFAGEEGRVFSEREKFRAAIRFLKWHRYRRKGATENETVSDW